MRSPLPRVRRICLALPEAHEKIAWGEPTFRVRDKLFAMFANNHHGDGRIALWCKAAPGAQEDLVAADPKHFFVPPYVGKAGWLGIRLDRGTATSRWRRTVFARRSRRPRRRWCRSFSSASSSLSKAPPRIRTACSSRTTSRTA
jgi:hypothetical protein